MNSVGASGSNPVGMAFREWRLVTILPALLLVCCTCAFAVDPLLDISQYAHTAWRVRDGFTKSTITSIAQTPDGYLWLGTELGLFRFDGVRAVPWQPPPGWQLPNSYITSLLVARDGTLWIGTLKGLASWKDGRLTQYPEVAGQIFGTLFQDHEGTVWFGLLAPGRLCAILGGKVQCYGAGDFGTAAVHLYEDAEGNLWVSATTGLWRWKAGRAEHFPLLVGFLEDEVIEDGDGSLLIATAKGLERLAGGKIQSYALPGVTAHLRAYCFHRGSDSSLWIGTRQGLLHLHQGKTDIFGTAHGLSGDDVNRIFEDREGNIWVATTNGLDRFREYPIPTISRNEGLSSLPAWSVQATKDGSVWLGTSDGLNRWANGRMTLYQGQRALGQGRQRDNKDINAGETVTEAANSGLLGTPQSLGVDGQGRPYVSTGNGVFCFEDGRFVRVPGIPGGNIWSIAEDGNGKTWISDLNRGLLSFGPGNVVQSIPWLRFGQKSFGARALLPDRTEDGVWLAFYEGGIAYFKDGKVRAAYTAADGLGSGRVSHLRFGSRGAIWAATEGGLSRIKDGHIETLSSKNGLPCDEVHWSMEDDDHAMWVYMPCGLARIDRSEWYAWTDDPRHVVKATLFDTSDGVGGVGVYGGYGPHVTKSPDGRIWFVPRDGVSVIDPRHLPFNKIPPPVHIEQITADGKNYDPAHASLPSHVRDLTIDYTALSLTVPEKVRFRIMLEGQDADWREMVNVRQVRYTNLSPRHYRFRVIAANNSGVWNTAGASLDFDIPPAWYQTMWFRAICIAAFMTVLWAVYQLRVHQLREQEKKFREAVETMPALAFLADSNSNRTFLNRGWLEYTGLRLEEALGSGWMRVIHPDDLTRVNERWRAAQMTGEPLDYEVRLRRGSDGVYRWFQTRARPLRDSHGKIEKWCAVLNDIEDRKQAERLQADVTHANRVSTMGELVASISHELAQPITVTGAHAKASLRWLQRDPPNLAEALSGIPKIVEASALAAGIIDRLRSLYKKSPPKRDLIEINEVIGDMTGMLRSEARSHGVSIRTDLKNDLPMTVADRVQLQQVLMNLMLNGIEAMSETGGVLTVKSQLIKDGQLQISVNDTGPGLSHGKKDQLFEPFFTTKPQGSGMGLAICKSIVESHGGRIWANGNGGRGATFHFTLPAAPAEGDPPLNAA